MNEHPTPRADPDNLPPKLTPVRGYRRLTYGDLGLMLQLTAEGKTQTDIAQRFGCDQTTISQALRRLGVDSTALAKHVLRSKSYLAARRATRLVTSRKEDVALKASRLVLEGAGVIETAQSSFVSQVQVTIGTAQTPAWDASTITVQGPVSPESGQLT